MGGKYHDGGNERANGLPLAGRGVGRDEALRCCVVVHEVAEEAQEVGRFGCVWAGFGFEAGEGFRVNVEGKAGAFGHGYMVSLSSAASASGGVECLSFLCMRK